MSEMIKRIIKAASVYNYAGSSPFGYYVYNGTQRVSSLLSEADAYDLAKLLNAKETMEVMRVALIAAINEAMK